MKDIVSLGRCECRWPVDEVDGAHMFCAEATAVGQSYCPKHRVASVVGAPLWWWPNTRHAKGLVSANSNKFTVPAVDTYIKMPAKDKAPLNRALTVDF